jgi:carbonic anhydrase
VNLSQTTVVSDVWARGQALTVHGWVYDLRDGLIRDLGMSIGAADEIAVRADVARSRVPRTPSSASAPIG